jgi:hypothetical protein
LVHEFPDEYSPSWFYIAAWSRLRGHLHSDPTVDQRQFWKLYNFYVSSS